MGGAEPGRRGIWWSMERDGGKGSSVEEGGRVVENSDRREGSQGGVGVGAVEVGVVVVGGVGGVEGEWRWSR